MLFTPENNAKSEELKEFIPVSSNSYSRLAVYLSNAEKYYLGKVVDPDTLAYFSTVDNAPAGSAVFSGSALEDFNATKEAIHLAKTAVANIALHLGYDVMNAEISASGFKRIETESEKSLFKYQEDKLRETFKSTGFNTLDALLNYMHDNVEYFPHFYDSEYFTDTSRELVPDTRTFNNVYHINNSCLVFKRMLPFLKRAEELNLASDLGGFYTELKADLAKKEPGEKYLKALPYVQKYLVYMSVYYAMPEVGVNIADNAVYFAENAGTQNDGNTELNVSDDRVTLLAERAKSYAEAYMRQLKTLLKTSFETELKTSDFPIRDNTDKKTFWT